MLLPTVLAGIVIADVDIFSAEAHVAFVALTDVVFQSENARQLKIRPYGSSENGMILKDLDFSLKPQDEGLLPTHDPHRLVARIEKKDPL